MHDTFENVPVVSIFADIIGIPFHSNGEYLNLNFRSKFYLGTTV